MRFAHGRRRRARLGRRYVPNILATSAPPHARRPAASPPADGLAMQIFVKTLTVRP